MLIQFNEEQKMVRDMVREFTRKEVEPRDYHVDQNDAFDRELFARFNELGLGGVLVPEEYGGMGSDYVTSTIIIHELAKGSASETLTATAANGHYFIDLVPLVGAENLPRLLDQEGNPLFSDASGGLLDLGESCPAEYTYFYDTRSVVGAMDVTVTIHAPVPVEPETPIEPETPTEPETPSGYADAAMAQEIFALINARRSENQRPELLYCNALQAAVDLRAKECAERFSHIRPDGSNCYTAFTVGYHTAGENIAQMSSLFASAEGFMGLWMDSPGHRDNILSPRFGSAAVGVYVDPSNLAIYAVQLFIG